jgi:hypothetical protein
MNFLVYTNCQGDEIRKYLKYSDEFNKRFTGEACFMPHHFNGRDPVVPIQLLENTDLFIYQPFSSRRGVLNTVDSNGVMKYLKKDSLKISFPSLYCDIFPIYEEDQIDGFHYYYGPSLKLVRKIKGLKKVEGLLSEGFNKDQIVKMFQN